MIAKLISASQTSSPTSINDNALCAKVPDSTYIRLLVGARYETGKWATVVRGNVCRWLVGVERSRRNRKQPYFPRSMAEHQINISPSSVVSLG